MNKINDPKHIQTQRIPVEIDVMNTNPTQPEDRNQINYSAEIQALEAYLKTLGMPTAKRSKLCFQVEASLQSQGYADSSQLPLWRLIEEAHHIINLDKGYLDTVKENRNWIMSSADWRLRSWLMGGAPESQHASKNTDEIPDIETLLIAPPVRRVSMPVANLKHNEWEIFVQFFMDKLAVIGGSTAQTFRRLLANTSNG